MTQGKDVRFAITVRNDEDANRIVRVIHELKFHMFDLFTSPRETYRVASRKQYDFFITYQTFPDMTGLTMIQSLRATGNYGLESHLVLVDSIDREIMLVLAEYNIKYVVQKPFQSDHINQKLFSLWREEQTLSPAELAYREAHAAFQSGLVEMALDLALKLVRDHKSVEKYLLLLGDIFLKCGKNEEARKVYQKARETFPQSYVPAHKIAKLLMKEKCFTEAAHLLNDLSRLCPLNLEILANTGLSNFEIGRYEESKAAMNKLKSLDHQRKDANEILARVAIREGDYRGSMKMLMESHGESELLAVIQHEADALREQSAYVRVVDFYLKSLDILGKHPLQVDLYYALGLAYQDIYDDLNARRYLQKALQLKPEHDLAARALKKIAGT